MVMRDLANIAELYEEWPEFRYDAKHDLLYITLKKGEWAKTIPHAASVILDLDKEGDVLGIEILDIMHELTDPENRTSE